MTLCLLINRAPDGIKLEGERKTVDSTPMSIGRGKVCDWVVEDPNRFLSSRHCEISFFGGAYYITDFSTNGTFINAAADPLGRGAQAALNPGDTIIIGDYHLIVENAPAHANANTPSVNTQALLDSGLSTDAVLSGSDPLGPMVDPSSSSDSGWSNRPPPLSTDQADPFSGSVDNLNAMDPLQSQNASDWDSNPIDSVIGGAPSDALDGFLNGAGASSEPPVSLPLAEGNRQGWNDLSSSTAGKLDSHGVIEPAETVDPLAAFDQRSPSHGAGISPVSSLEPFSVPGPASEGFGAVSNSSSAGLTNRTEHAGAGADPWDRAGATMHTPNSEPSNSFPKSSAGVMPSAGMNDAMEWPSTANSALIPDDWDDDLLGSPSGAKGESLAANSLDSLLAPLPQDKQPLHEDTIGEDQLVPNEWGNGSVPNHGNSIQDDWDRAPVEQGASQLSNFESSSSSGLTRAAQPTQPASTGSVQGSVQDSISANGTEDNSGTRPGVDTRKDSGSPSLEKLYADTIIRGMGLNPEAMTAEHKLDIHNTVGALLPVITSGMMQVLRSRASVKNEFRMNVTTIQPVENNPLKFSASAAEAHDNMFVRDSKAYKGAIESFQEGFDSIAEHQTAVIAGIRAAFRNVLQRFDPEILEQQFANKGLLAKAKLWSQYRDYHKDLTDNMDHTFQYLFGDDFVEAYEDQLRKLEAERRRIGS